MTVETRRCPRCDSARVSLHGENLPALGEADYWAPTREEGFMCADCSLQERCLMNAGADYDAFRERWKDPAIRQTREEYERAQEELRQMYAASDREWTWPAERNRMPDVQDRARRMLARAEGTFSRAITIDDHVEFIRMKALPAVAALADVLRRPEDDAARGAYVDSIRELSHPLAAEVVAFIEAQLTRAAMLRSHPRAGLTDQSREDVFWKRTERPDDWWRLPVDYELRSAMFEGSEELERWGLIADSWYARGFIEHVTMKAHRFLELAEELYAAAPIRHLTLTYVKGFNHDDDGLWAAVLASPHLDRIRSLRLPVRMHEVDRGNVTEMNRLTDADVERLAASTHLRGLRYLDLEDQRDLTIGAFDALARSEQLPELSAVRHDINRYVHPGAFSFGTVGAQERQLVRRPLAGYRAELEAKHGYRHWLHVAEHYGTEDPDVEAVVEYPVAVKATARIP